MLSYEPLRGLGYVEGNNFVIEQRYASVKAEPLPGLGADLVATYVDVLVTIGNVATAAAKPRLARHRLSSSPAIPWRLGLSRALPAPVGT